MTCVVFSTAGEIEVQKDLDIIPLLPETGSFSDARDLRRTARLERYFDTGLDDVGPTIRTSARSGCTDCVVVRSDLSLGDGVCVAVV